MSLINDALKRAGEAQRTQRAPRIPDAIMQPVEETPKPPRGPRMGSPALVRVIIGVAVLVVAAVLFVVWWQKRPQPVQPSQPLPNMGKADAKKSAPPNDKDKKLSTKMIQDVAKLTTPGTPTTKQPDKSAVSTNVAVIKDSSPKTNTATVSPPPVAVTNKPPAETNAAPLVAVTQPKPVEPPSPTETVKPEPPAVKTPPAPSFPAIKLQGIIYRLKNPSALVNGHNVSLGDIVESARVVSIERDSVFFEFNGRTNEVFLLR